MRRKTLKKSLAMILAMAMVFTVNPVMAQEELIGDGKSLEKAQEKKSDNYAEGEAIIMYYNDTTSAKSRTASILGGDMEITDTYTFEMSNAKARTSSVAEESNLSVSLVKSDTYSTEELVDMLSKKSNVKYAEPNYKIKKLDYNDKYYKYQWALDNKGQNAGIEGLDINADTDLLSDKDDKERVIAVVDTGMDYTHEDLKDVVWNNPFNNKKLYGEHGYDFINYDADPMDDNGHGSHCSGIMAGKSNNGVGIVGTAKSENIKIMALKILDEEGSGYGMEAVGAYNYIYKAQQLGINIVAVNNSWGGADDEEFEILKTLIDLVGKNGAISVCAAGNESMDNDTYESIPANIDSDYVISVAASNEKDELATFSNYGKKNVDIAAPGTNILSSVSYNCFNPSIYDNPLDLCSTYHSFDTENLAKVIDENGYTEAVLQDGEIPYGTYSDGEGEVQVSTTNSEYLGEKSDTDKSLKWEIKGAKAESIHYLYLPYDVNQSDTGTYLDMALKMDGPDNATDDSLEEYFESSLVVFSDYILDDNGKADLTDLEEGMIGMTSIEKRNYWSKLNLALSDKTKKKEKHVIALAIYVMAEGDYSISIDDFGVSKENVSEEEFGKYDYYNGTSMATPYVTGAVAAVANAYPDETALQTKARVLGSVRKSENLKDKVATGGVLDLSKVGNPSIFVEKANINSKNQIEINGYYMDNAEVYVDDKKVDIISNDGKTIVIDGSQLYNKQISIKVEKDGLSYEDTYFFTKGKAFNKGASAFGTLKNGQLLSSGNSLIYIDYSGTVSYAFSYTDEETNKETMMWMEGSNPVTGKMFGKEYEYAVDYLIYSATDYVYTNGKIYGCFTLDVGYATEQVLAVYDDEKGWTKLDEMPEDMEGLEGSTLTAYNGDLYLMGGIDEDGNVINKVAKYSINAKKWTSEGNLPDTRAYSKAMQVGKKLILTLGTNGTNDIPKNMIFDGKNWTISKAKLGKSIDSETYYYGTKQFTVTTAEVGLVKDGIVYTNLRVEDMGDTFTYSVNKDSFTASQYALNSSQLKCDILRATTVQDKLYVLYGDEYVEDYEDEEFLSTKSYDSEGSLEDEYEGGISTLYIPVTNGYVSVVDKSEMGGYVEGAGYYLPGDTITLTAKAEDEFIKIDKFLVNGKSIAKGSKGYVYTINASDCPSVITAQVVASFGDIDVPMPKLTKAKISKATRAKNNKKISLTLKRVKNATGYQIKYSTSKKFAKKVTNTITSKKLKVTLNKLKTKKKYYIKARAYVSVNGKKKYGAWSNVKVINIKKKAKTKK